MPTTRLANDGTLIWWCPGCDEAHGVPIRGEKAWGWNQSMVAPTLTPSVHVHPHEGTPGVFKDQPRCHVFIQNGMIQFLGDCEHHLAGQTVPIPEWE